MLLLVIYTEGFCTNAPQIYSKSTLFISPNIAPFQRWQVLSFNQKLSYDFNFSDEPA
jgi:hypothetical protein